MSIAIKRASGNLYWFDAVIQYNRSHQNEITRHPVEKGRNISDHTIRQNIQFTLTGVLTDADFNTTRPNIRLGNYSPDELADEATYKSFVNNTPVYQTPTISFGRNPLIALLPSSVSQFLGEDSPTVTLFENDKARSAMSISRDFEEMRDTAELFEVIEYRPDGSYRVFKDCTLKGVSFNFDADSGDAFYPNLEIEQIRYTTSKYAALPSKLIKKAVSKKATLGNKQTSDTKTTSDPNVTKEQRVSILKQGTKMATAQDTVVKGK